MLMSQKSTFSTKSDIINHYFPPATGSGAEAAPAAPPDLVFPILHSELRADLPKFKSQFASSFNHHKLEIRNTLTMGLGLYSTARFKVGDQVALYTKVYHAPEMAASTAYDYAYAYVDNHGFAMATNEEFEYGPFINDLLSAERNKIKFQWINNKLFAIATSAIVPGEQLGVAYGPEHWIHYLNNHSASPTLITKVLQYYSNIQYDATANPPYRLQHSNPVDVIIAAYADPNITMPATSASVATNFPSCIDPDTRHTNAFELLDTSDSEDPSVPSPSPVFFIESDDDSDDSACTHQANSSTPQPDTQPINVQLSGSDPNVYPLSTTSGESNTPPASVPPTQIDEANMAAFQQLYDANLCDWQELLQPGALFYSLVLNAFVTIDDVFPSEANIAAYPHLYECYVAIKENVPKTFAAAMQDPIWREAALKEFNMLINTKCLVRTPVHLALEDIQERQAQVLHLIPCYEKKVDENGLPIYKVRLVVNGSVQKASAADTYAATPSREQLLILLHIIASHDWEYWHVDESRAFISSERQALTD